MSTKKRHRKRAYFWTVNRRVIFFFKRLYTSRHRNSIHSQRIFFICAYPKKFFFFLSMRYKKFHDSSTKKEDSAFSERLDVALIYESQHTRQDRSIYRTGRGKEGYENWEDFPIFSLSFYLFPLHRLFWSISTLALG